MPKEVIEMKKRDVLKALILCLGCMCFWGCDTTPDEVEPAETLTISFDLPETPASIPSYYRTESMYLDTDTLLEYFFEGEDPIEVEGDGYIQGDTFYTLVEGSAEEFEKFLMNWNGGQVRDLPGATGFYGGFSFTQSYVDGKKMPYSDYSLLPLRRRGYSNERYAMDIDLAFRPRAEVEEEVDTLLKNIGLTQAVRVETRCMEVKTMQAYVDEQIQRQERLREENAQYTGWDSGKTLEPYMVSPGEEAYLLYYAQGVDGNVFCDFDTGLGIPTPGGYVLYGESGILDVNLTLFADITQTGEPAAVASPQECLNEYIREYNQNIEADPEELTMMGLYYVSTDLNDTVEKEYIPAWILEIRSEGIDQYGNPSVDYQYRVWNALSGEGMTKMR